jgi:orotate phosphoribosyltransferase
MGDGYKERFVKFLLETGALKVFDNQAEDRKLKSGRISPWFVNIGDLMMAIIKYSFGILCGCNNEFRI